MLAFKLKNHCLCFSVVSLWTVFVSQKMVFQANKTCIDNQNGCKDLNIIMIMNFYYNHSFLT